MSELIPENENEMFRVSLEKSDEEKTTELYEGPLDLLLSLIIKHKINIFDIPIAQIADQYMEYLHQMEELDMDIASEYIVMASELMLIKSRMLLPKEDDAPDPRKELVDALLLYQRAKNTAEFLKTQSALYFDRFTKDPDEASPIYTRKHDPGLLREAIQLLEERLSAKPPEPVALFEKIQYERNYTVEEKREFLNATLKYCGRATFLSLFDGCGSRNEIIATFLALLDMLKEGKAVMARSATGTITVELSHTTEQ